MRQDESFSACLEILQLENSDYTQLPAHYRLLWSVVAAAMKQNAINTFIQKRGLVPQKEDEVKADEEKQYIEEKKKLPMKAIQRPLSQPLQKDWSPCTRRAPRRSPSARLRRIPHRSSARQSSSQLVYGPRSICRLNACSRMAA